MPFSRCLQTFKAHDVGTEVLLSFPCFCIKLGPSAKFKQETSHNFVKDIYHPNITMYASSGSETSSAESYTLHRAPSVRKMFSRMRRKNSQAYVSHLPANLPNDKQISARHLHMVYPGFWLALEDHFTAAGHPTLDSAGVRIEKMLTPNGDHFTHVLALSSLPGDEGYSYSSDLNQCRLGIYLPPCPNRTSWGLPNLTPEQISSVQTFCGMARFKGLPRRGAQPYKPNVLIVASRDTVVDAVALAVDAFASYQSCALPELPRTLQDARNDMEMRREKSARVWQRVLSSEGVRTLSVADES
ncbi:hypothetical protein HGRIS_004212 [Hohenbuehelia grisea]|uniref:Uncharacterized protein n=1 Tax=Hohenbuehelia grisea TaxID=104357 RepID=A0ABR3JII7_9AGAR